MVDARLERARCYDLLNNLNYFFMNFLHRFVHSGSGKRSVWLKETALHFFEWISGIGLLKNLDWGSGKSEGTFRDLVVVKRSCFVFDGSYRPCWRDGQSCVWEYLWRKGEAAVHGGEEGFVHQRNRKSHWKI